MTEFDCFAVVDDTEYDFLTLGCPTMAHAINQFSEYLAEAHGVTLIHATNLEFTAIEVDANLH